MQVIGHRILPGSARGVPRRTIAVIAGFTLVLGSIGRAPFVDSASAQQSTLPYRLFAPGASAAGSSAAPVISEVRDPDEAAFGVNDLGLVRVTANETTVRVRIESADGQPLVLDPPSTGVIVRFYWFLRPEGGEADYIQVFLFGDHADVYQLDTSTGAGRFSHSTIDYTKTGGVIEFELPRTRFRAADRVSWVAYGSGGGGGQDLAPNDDDANPNQSGVPPAVIVLR